MDHYSPSSDDSPLDRRHSIRLSDIQHAAPRSSAAASEPKSPAFARADNRKGIDALSIIHGSQVALRSSIQKERQRIREVTEEVQANHGALFQSPRRKPPKPPQLPQHQSHRDDPIESASSLHILHNVGDARSRLSDLIHRERMLRLEIERNAHPTIPMKRPSRRPAPAPLRSQDEELHRRDNLSVAGSTSVDDDRHVGRSRDVETRRARRPHSADGRTASTVDDFREGHKGRYHNKSASADGFRRRNLDRIKNIDIERDSDRADSDRWHHDQDNYSDDHNIENEVPLSSLTVKSLFDSQREASLRLKSIAAELANADTFEDIALCVGKGFYVPAMRAIGIEQCSVWFLAPAAQHLWTRDSFGVVSTDGSAAVPTAFTDCRRRQGLDRGGIGMRHTVVVRDPDCTNVEEFDNYVTTLGGLTFESYDSRAPTRKDRKFAVDGIENWTSVYTTDWSAATNSGIDDHQPHAGCIAAALKKNSVFAYLGGSENLFVEQTLSQLSLLVTARVTVLLRKIAADEYENRVQKQHDRLHFSRRLLSFSALFDAAQDEVAVGNLLARAGTEVFQDSLVINGAENAKKGTVVSRGTNDAFFGPMYQATPSTPGVFSCTLAGVSACGLLQFSNIDAFAGNQELTVLSVAIGTSENGADNLPNIAGFLLTVWSRNVIQSGECLADYKDSARHLSRWAQTALKRVKKVAEASRWKDLAEVLPVSLQIRSSDESKTVIEDLNAALAQVLDSAPADTDDSDHLIGTVSALSRPTIAAALGAERSFLLITAALLDKFAPPDAAATDHFSLYGLKLVESTSRQVSTTSNELAIFCDLVGGNPIVNEKTWKAHGLPGWVGQLRQRRSVYLESMYTRPARGVMESEEAELRNLVRTTDSDAVTALLVPIFEPSPRGVLLGVLMLTNKLRRVDGNNDDVPPLFGDTDRTHMDESGISSVIGGVLQTAVLQDKARRLMRRYSALSRSFSACENHIVHLSKKNSMLDKFSSWKFAAAMNAESSRKEEENAVLSRFTESITALLRDLHSMRGCSVDQLIGAIQSRVQDVFCDDHVAVEMVGEPSRYVPSPMSRISTPSKSGQRDVSKSELIREIYGVKIVGNVAVEADSVKYILNQIPVDAETLRPLIGQEISVSFTEDQLRNWDYEMRKLHIRVKISRLSLVDRGQLLDSPFSALEEKLMASLCDTVGEALLLESPLSVAQMAVAVVRSVLGQLPPRVSLHRPPLEQECAPSAMQVRSPAPLREVSQTYSDTYSSSFASGTSLSSSFSSSSSESSDSSSSTSIGPDQPPLSPRKRSILPESHTLADTMASAPLQPDPQIVYLLSEPELVKISDELGDELISCLLQVLPALFGGISSDVSSERGTHVARDLCYSLSLCLKRISKGDIALLHILSNGAARNQDTTDHGYISSEDTSANDIFSNLAMSSEENCLHQFVRDEISKRKPNADEECVEGVNGGNMQFQLLDGLHGQGALGEVKIITAAHENARKQQKGFASLTYKEDDLNSVRRKQGVAIICYLISLSLAIPLKLQEMSNLVVGSKQQVTVLEESLTVATKLLMAEKNLTEGLRGKLSAMMALIVLVEKITKMPTLDDLARVVAEGLPTVLGVESAVLLLPPSTVAKCTYCAEGTQGIFSEAWAASAALPGTEDLVAVTGMNTGSEHSGGMHVTWKQVRQVPLFSSAAVGSVAQSHIPLSTPNAAPKVSAGVFNYGALLLFSPQKGDAPQSLAGSWVGLEDYLISSISAAIFGVLSDFRNMSTIAGYSSGMATLEQLRGKNIEYQEVVSGLRDAHEAAAQHMNEKDDQINSLRIEIESAGENYNANLKELSTILSEVDKKSIAMQQEAESSIFQLRQEQAELSALLHLEQSDHSALRSLVQSFVSFPGSNSDIAGTERWALTWLQDFAHAQGYALGTVQRGYGSDLTLTLLNMPLSNQKVIREDSPDYAAIRSTVISASVEALRCRDIVECSIDQHGGRTTGNTDVGLSVTIRSPLSDQGSKYSAVCIPNRYGSDGNTAYASFVFLKVEDSIKEVVSNEVQSGKELIMWASNLAGRVLCGQEMIGGGMSSLGAENKLLRCAIMQKETLEVMLNTAVTMVSELWLRNISTTGDVCKALETYSALLLTPMHSENREGKDDIDCNVVAEVILVKKKKSKDSAVRKVVQSGRTLRAGMALYLPIASRVSEKGSLVGVLCIERKPTGFREDRDTEGPSKTTADNRISSLAISQDEETALKLLCALSVPSFERIALVSDTYNGITQASRAMEALQDMHEELRNKLADEITSKYLLQDVLKQSTATLNAMITRGSSVGQVHEALRKGVMTVLGAQECHVVSDNPAVFLNSYTGMPPLTSGTYYTLNEDKLDAMQEVELLKGDVELITLQTGRPIIFTIASSRDRSGHEEWGSKSWAVRRYLERAHSFTQLHADSTQAGSSSPLGIKGLSSTRGIPQSEGDQTSPVHVMAIPYNVKNGAIAVIVVVRKGFEFSKDDKDCLAHLLKVSSVCMCLDSANAEVLEAKSSIATLIGQSEAEMSRKENELHAQLYDAVETVYLGNDGFDDKAVVCAVAEAAVATKEDGTFGAVSVETFSKMVFGRETSVDLRIISEADFQMLSTSKLPVLGSNASKAGALYEESAWKDSHLPVTGILRLHTLTSYYWVDLLHSSVAFIAKPRSSNQQGGFMATVNLNRETNAQLTGREDVHIALLRMKLIYLLRMLSLQSNWVQTLLKEVDVVVTNNTTACNALEARCNELFELCARQELEKENQFEKWNKQYDSDILNTKDRYKSLMFDRSRSQKLTEMFFKTSMTSCVHAMTESAIIKASAAKGSKKAKLREKVLSNSATALLKVLVRACGDMAIGMTTRICFCKSPATLSSPSLSSATISGNFEGGGADVTSGGVPVTWVNTTAVDSKHAKPSRSSQDRAVISQTHPIYLCMSLCSYVLVMHGEDHPDVIDEIQRSQANSNSIPVIVCRSNEYAHGTLFVPVVAPQSEMHKQRVYFAVVATPAIADSSQRLKMDHSVKKIVEKKDEASFNWHVSMKNLIFCWNIIRETCTSVAFHHEGAASDRFEVDKAKKREAIFLFNAVCGRVRQTYLRQSFSVWKNQQEFEYRLSQMSQNYNAEQQRIMAHATVLEKAAADWSEIVKSVNGVAASSLAQGLRGVWAQACVPFMSLMSNHVEVVGCGLLIANHLDEILELSVKGSEDFNNSISNDTPYKDSNSDSIKIRTASELGAGVLALTWSIISGNLEERGEFTKRIWKLNKQNTLGVFGGEKEIESRPLEQMWLVPVRTAWAVLGVMRLSLRPSLHVVNEANFDDNMFIQEGDVEINNPMEQAKRNMINFAEVMAPIVLAARQIDVSTSRESEMAGAVQQYSQRERAAVMEARSCIAKARLVSRATADISSLMETFTLRDIEDLREDIVERERHNRNNSTFPALSENGATELSVLRRQLEQTLTVSLGHSVTITINDGRGSVTATGSIDSLQVTDYIKRQEMLQSNEEGQKSDSTGTFMVKSGAVSITEIIKNDTGDVLGTITVTLSAETVPNETVEAIPDRDSNVTAIGEQRFFDQEAISGALPVVSKLLCTFLVAVQRRKETHAKLSSLSDIIFNLEGTIADAHSFSENAIVKGKAAESEGGYYKVLAEMSSQCLSINAAITNYLDVVPSGPNEDLNSEMIDELFESEVQNNHIFDDRSRDRHKYILGNTGLLLGRFCDKIEVAMGGRCSFRFGLVTRDRSQALLDDGQWISAEEARVLWYHGSNTRAGSMFVPSEANMGQGGAQIVNNLAAACISSMLRSSVDVGFSGSGNEADSVRMTVLSIPLPSTRLSKISARDSSRSLGVLQIFIPGLEANKSPVDVIGSEIAAAVSATLTNINMLQELSGQLDKLSKIAIDVQGTAEQAHLASDFWKVRAKQWRGIGLMCCSLIKGFSSGMPLIKSLLADDTMEYLTQAGITVVRVGQNKATQGLPSSESAASSYASASMTVPLSTESAHSDENDSNNGNDNDEKNMNAAIEISCTSVAPPVDRNSNKSRVLADKHAEDMVSLVGSLIQSVEISMKSYNGTTREISSRCRAAETRAERLAADIEVIRRESRDMTQRQEVSNSELNKKVEIDFRFNKFSVSFLSNVVVPAVREVVQSIGQLVEQYHNDTVKLRPQLNVIGDGGGGNPDSSRRQVDLRAALTLDRAYTSIAVACDRAIKAMINQQLGETDVTFASSVSTHEAGRNIWKKIVESTTADVAIPVYYHASVLVRRERAAHDNGDDVSAVKLNPKYASYDGSTGSHSLIPEKDISRAFSKENQIQRRYHSIMEKCFQLGGVQTIDISVEDVMLGTNFSYLDLLGIDVSTITILLSTSVGNASSDGPSTARLRVCCIPLGGSDDLGTRLERVTYRAPAVVRCVWVEAWASGNGGEHSKPMTTSLLPNLLELMCSNSAGILRWLSELANVEDKLYAVELDLQTASYTTNKLETELSRCRRLYRVVAREAASLFDPPLSSGSVTAMMALQSGESADSTKVLSNKFTHPAYLAPIAATQDVCLKFLHIVRSLARSEGQAILLTDIDTVPMSFQLIFTGDGLTWPASVQGVFGKVNPTVSGSSLIESAIKSHKAVVVSDMQKDVRYLPQVDGSCAPRTPAVVIPLRGRGGVVIGAVIAARGEGGPEFSIEDVTSLDLAATLSSLSLYWCRGLGSVHIQLDKTLNRMMRLEHAVQVLRSDDKSGLSK